MSLQFFQQPLGLVRTNCYVVCDQAGNALVIDPGAEQPSLFQLLERAGVQRVEWILLTHGHFDHILGVYSLKERYPNAKIAIHTEDARCLRDEMESRAGLHIPGKQKLVHEDVLLIGGESLPFEYQSDAIQVLHTPGHTPGSVCYIFETQKWIFSGDTLFFEDIGRTDFPGGSLKTLLQSLQKLDSLPGDYTVCPGHDQSTTLEHERSQNPHWKHWD